MSNSVFEQSLSHAGTRVRSRHDAGQVGECTGRTRDDGDGLMVHVRFPGQQPQFEMVEDLEPAEIVLDERQQVLAGKFADAAGVSYGTHMPRSDWSVLRELPLLNPPASEQIAIANVLAEMDAELFSLEARRNKTHALKQAMMQELLTGRTRIV